MTSPDGTFAEMLFCDLHTHILPGVDDGSRSCAQSVRMLESMAQQGVGFIAATPHYYADVCAPEAFFAARDAAWARLKQEPICARFEIRLGAEVQYYEGITRLERPERFCLEGTDLFLLEMPFVPWSERILSNVRALSEDPSLRVVIAHVERYMPLQSRYAMQTLLDMDVLLQYNAAFFLPWRTRRRALRMMKRGMVHFIGSDCHNTETRAPDVGRAMAVIEKRAGPSLAQEFLQREKELLRLGSEG